MTNIESKTVFANSQSKSLHANTVNHNREHPYCAKVVSMLASRRMTISCMLRWSISPNPAWCKSSHTFSPNSCSQQRVLLWKYWKSSSLVMQQLAQSPAWVHDFSLGTLVSLSTVKSVHTGVIGHIGVCEWMACVPYNGPAACSGCIPAFLPVIVGIGIAEPAIPRCLVRFPFRVPISAFLTLFVCPHFSKLCLDLDGSHWGKYKITT